jgi:hypothetical protein
MHDEALTDFEAVISQLERGHSFLNKTFDIPHPTVGWQIDPFGHSALTPTLMQKFGYEVLVVSRIDERLKLGQLHMEGNLEFMWKGADLGSQTAMLTHDLYKHYSMPRELNPLDDYSCWSYRRNNLEYW